MPEKESLEAEKENLVPQKESLEAPSDLREIYTAPKSKIAPRIRPPKDLLKLYRAKCPVRNIIHRLTRQHLISVEDGNPFEEDTADPERPTVFRGWRQTCKKRKRVCGCKKDVLNDNLQAFYRGNRREAETYEDDETPEQEAVSKC